MKYNEEILEKCLPKYLEEEYITIQNKDNERHIQNVYVFFIKTVYFLAKI